MASELEKIHRNSIDTHKFVDMLQTDSQKQIGKSNVGGTAADPLTTSVGRGAASRLAALEAAFALGLWVARFK